MIRAARAISIAAMLAIGASRAAGTIGADDPGVIPADAPKGPITKCETRADGLEARFAKAILICLKRATAAASRFQPCLDGATGKFDVPLTKIAGCPSCLDRATLDDQVVAMMRQLSQHPYCTSDGTAFPGGFTGKIPPDAPAGPLTRCANGVAQAAGKLLAKIAKCHVDRVKMSKKVPDDAAEEACEDAARASFVAKTRTDDCDPCVDTTAIGGAVEAAVDAGTGATYCSPGATSTTVSTTTTSSTTSTIPVPCGCCGGQPTFLEITTGTSGGTCGDIQADSGVSPFTLTCGGLYFGGAGVAVPLPAIQPDQEVARFKTFCTSPGTTNLVLSGTSSGDTGSNRTCTNTGCLFGAPLPIANGSHGGAATSTCVINTVAANASGTGDCGTGSIASLSLPLTSGLFLTGDLLPNRCSGGSTPGAACTPPGSACPDGGVCADDTGRCATNGAACAQDGDCPSGQCQSGACAGGGNAGRGCVTDVDCPGGACRTLIQPCPICNPTTLTCNGGPNDGLACTPADSAVDGDYPTSHDCPPPPARGIGSLPIALDLTTGPTSKIASDNPTPPPADMNVFCGYCGSIIGTFKNPPVPCTSGADCSAVPGFTHCRQRNPGAFTAVDVARTIHMTGSPATGICLATPPVPMKLVSIFCIPPTFNPLVDSAANLPGPGATSLTGTMALLP